MFFNDAPRRLWRLGHVLRDGRYRPGPIRHVEIPKPGGRGVRPLAIPCVVDRIAQTAVSDVLMPLLDEEFEPASFGYRPGRSVKQAVERVRTFRGDAYEWVVDADIEKYFEKIPHDMLMARWAESVADGPLTELIWTWLTHAAPDGRGVSQGSPLSPLLANLYLDRIDEALDGRGARLIRFADDFVILCRSKGGAERALDKTAALLAEHGLRLNREKTRIVDFARGFRFLGHLFVRSMVMKVAPQEADRDQIEAWMLSVAKSDATAQSDDRAEQAEAERRERAGYSPGLRTLYVRVPDRRLHIRNEAFVVEQGEGSETRGITWRELIAIPHQQVDRIEIGPGIRVSDEAERHALATDTPIAYTNGHGQTVGWLSAALTPRAGRHLAQARVALDESKRIDLARRLVEGRLRNQRAVLRRLLADRETRPQMVLDALVRLNAILGRGEKTVLRGAKSVSELTGHEGHATAAWWRAISTLARSEFRFSSRSRPRARDPANVSINFLAWLLERDVAVAVQRAGLHPGFGALHRPADRHDACVYDLMEEFRAHLVGGLFVYAVNRRFIRPDMFVVRANRVRMEREAGDALIRAYETRISHTIKSPRSGRRVTWRRLMVEQDFALANHVEGREPYQPYDMGY